MSQDDGQAALRETLRAEFKPLLEKLYLEGYRDSTRRASGMTSHAHMTFNKLFTMLAAHTEQLAQRIEAEKCHSGDLCAERGNCVCYWHKTNDGLDTAAAIVRGKR